MTIREIKAEARQLLRADKKRSFLLTLWFLLCIEGVTVLFNLLSSFSQMFTGSGISGIGTITLATSLSALLGFVANVLLTVWSCHYSNFSVKFSRGRETSFLDFVAPFRIFGSTILAMLLVYLKVFLRAMLCALAIGVLAAILAIFIENTLFYSLLILAAGIATFVLCYMIQYRYYFVFQALYDGDGCPAAIALRRSEALTKGNRFFLFKLDLSFLWYFIPMLLPAVVELLRSEDFGLLTGWPFPIQWLIPSMVFSAVLSFVLQLLFLPYVEVTKAVAYNRLRSQFVKPQEPVTPEDMPILLQESADSPEQSDDDPNVLS